MKSKVVKKGRWMHPCFIPHIYFQTFLLFWPPSSYPHFADFISFLTLTISSLFILPFFPHPFHCCPSSFFPLSKIPFSISQFHFNFDLFHLSSHLALHYLMLPSHFTPKPFHSLILRCFHPSLPISLLQAFSHSCPSISLLKTVALLRGRCSG